MRNQKRSGVLFRWAGSKHRVLDQIFAFIEQRQVRTERKWNNEADCFNKWPHLGGDEKDQLLSAPPFKRWIEPFVGGCSVALEAMRRQMAEEYVLADALPEIKAVLDLLTDDALRPWLFSALKYQQDKHIADQRANWNEERLGGYGNAAHGALRFLILQACSFNGLWRVNSKGQYNVPFGRAASFDFAALEEAAKLLRASRAQIHCQDFAKTIALAGAGDIVYADPPYIDQFSSYNAAKFSEDEHMRLADVLHKAFRRGAECWVSNSDTEAVRRIYRGEAYPIEARRSISCKGATRGVKRELLIRV